MGGCGLELQGTEEWECTCTSLVHGCASRLYITYVSPKCLQLVSVRRVERAHTHAHARTQHLVSTTLPDALVRCAQCEVKRALCPTDAQWDCACRDNVLCYGLAHKHPHTFRCTISGEGLRPGR